MRRLLIILGSLLLGWLGAAIQGPTALAGTPTEVHTYVYDGQDDTTRPNYTTTERGPPAVDSMRTIHNADGLRPLGALARPADPARSAVCDHGERQRLVRVASRCIEGERRGDSTWAETAVGEPWRVAAKAADDAMRGVDDVLGGLPKGRSSGVRTVGSDAELDEVYTTLTRGGRPYDVAGYKGTWLERSDGVRVGLRDASKSGGRTIDIRYPDGSTGKVHIE